MISFTNQIQNRSDDGEEWSLLIAGDCFLKGRDDRASIGEGVAKKIQTADISVANLEGVINSNGAPIDKVGPHLEMAVETPRLLSEAGFDLVTLANNHTMDYDVSGFRSTTAACARSGLSTVGAGECEETAIEPFVTTIGSTSIAIYNLCEREFGVAKFDSPGTAWISHPNAKSVVREGVATYDVVVLIAHGGIEYVPFPPLQRQRQLRSFIDLGVDAVIGHHPHVPQGWERHNGRPVFYSLGNFLMYIKRRPSTRWGMVVKLTFDEDRLLSAQPMLTQIEGESVSMLTNAEAHWKYLTRLSSITQDHDRLEPYWQEIAMREYERRYSRSPNPLVECVGILLRRMKYGSSRPKRYQLQKLNHLRNESQRAVIETALEIKTGVRVDVRTEQVSKDVDQLLLWTNDDLPTLVTRIQKAVS